MESAIPNENSRPIGVFDSGLGGLTVVRRLSGELPGENIVYLGDSARVPYGIKSLETVRQFALQCAAFLSQFGPKLIVVACNTASAAAIDAVEAACHVPVVDVVRPGAAAAVAATDKPIGVIGTEATIESGAYQRAIAALDSDRDVRVAACPLLVPIVEEGRREDDPIVLSVLSDYLRDLQRSRIGALILGCTHYPLLAEAIGKLMGPDVALISSASAAADDVRRRLTNSDALSTCAEGGRLDCHTTDNPERFTELAERFGGRPADSVQRVGTDELQAQPI
ncbi:MAG: glutamate racemase [Planctomycetota bacterium]|jgi:glutamate racemase